MSVRRIIDCAVFGTIVVLMVTNIYIIGIGFAYGYVFALKCMIGIAVSVFIGTTFTLLLLGQYGIPYNPRQLTVNPLNEY